MTPPAAVLAHGIGGREDLPLPLGWAIAGAAFAVVVSFVALGALWRTPQLDDGSVGRPLPAGLARLLDAGWFRALVAASGVAVALWTLLALVFGKDDALNPVPFVVFVLLWVGIVPLSVLLGPVWRWLNPVRRLHAGLSRVLGLEPAEGLAPLPRRVGWWPAAFGLLLFTWLELVYPDSTTLPALRWEIGLFVAVQVLAAFSYGSGWFGRCDPFEAWSGLFGRVSPLGRRDDGALVLRRPMVGLGLTRPEPGLVATVCVMLGSTAYDGLSGSTQWVSFAQSQSVSRTTVGTLGLVGTILLVAVLFVACTTAAGRLGGADPRAMPGAFAPSVVPVALGYVIAHYYSFLVLQGQAAVARLSDPLGTGADWLGTGSWQPNGALVTPSLVADVQVLAIVAGHVLGVVVAHDRAIRLFPRATAVLGQLPLLVLMVALTCTGLFLLFAG